MRTSPPEYSRLSAPGAAALGLWRLEGPRAAFLELLAPQSLPPPDSPSLRSLQDDAGRVLDQGVFWVRRDSGGRVAAEWHLHGGYGLAEAFEGRLEEAGWRRTPPRPASEDERRFLRARAPLPARVAAEAAEGVFDRAWEAGLTPQEASRWVAWAEVLEAPPALVLAGPPNSGKSTLFNAWLREERVTVSPHPGTTRDAVTAGLLLGTGSAAFEVWLTDTAGLWSAPGGLDRAAVEAARAALHGAWRVVWVLDAARAPGPELSAALESADAADLRLLHRCDLGGSWTPEARFGGCWMRGSILREGPALLDRLEAALLASLGPPPPPGAAVPLGAARRRLVSAARPAGGGPGRG